MAALSLEALAVEEALNAASLESPAACIRVVQLGEKAKLRMTCTLQVLKKSHSERRWSWQRTPEEAEEAEAAAAAMAASAHANEAAIGEENSSSNAGGGRSRAAQPRVGGISAFARGATSRSTRLLGGSDAGAANETTPSTRRNPRRKSTTGRARRRRGSWKMR